MVSLIVDYILFLFSAEIPGQHVVLQQWKYLADLNRLSFLMQVQHREKLMQLEETIQSKEGELGELLPTYNHLKTEETECSAR